MIAPRKCSPDESEGLDHEIDNRRIGRQRGALFMYSKSRLGLLPSFQPYQSFQIALDRWVGSDVPAIVPWLLSFLNGMAQLGLLFARIIQFLPVTVARQKD
jgi:hypothetical protein